jgi:hypothetical protein
MSNFKTPRKSLLDETNPLSILPDKRNPQADFYRMENRERQLDAINNLTNAEQAYVLGGVDAADVARGGNAARDQIKAAINKIHEKDLIELRALVYLQKLPDTSPELIQLKTLCGCDTREQIAGYIADKQIKKLMMSQIDAITGRDALTTMYSGTIVRGGTAFAGLFGTP